MVSARVPHKLVIWNTLIAAQVDDDNLLPQRCRGRWRNSFPCRWSRGLRRISKSSYHLFVMHLYRCYAQNFLGTMELCLMKYQAHGFSSFKKYHTPLLPIFAKANPKRHLWMVLVPVKFYFSLILVPLFKLQEFRQRKGGDLYNLSEFCYNSSLVVAPKKGRAVIFYNHFLDDQGFLGKM